MTGGNSYFAVGNQDGTSRYLSINNLGYVGVGTTDPSWQFQISSQYPYLALQDTDSANGSMGTITYNQDGNFYFDADNPDTATSGGYHFRADGASKYLMSITNSGNVGIGTTAPGDELHLAADGRDTNSR